MEKQKFGFMSEGGTPFPIVDHFTTGIYPVDIVGPILDWSYKYKMNDELGVIEDLLLDNNIEIEDYRNPEKGISRLEAVCNTIEKLIDYKFRYESVGK